MRIFYKGKDGGPESPVTGYWLIEIKNLFSICLLKFNKGCRENYHSHAFNAYTWFIKGDLIEERIMDNTVIYKKYNRSIIPKLTKRDNLHRVSAIKDSWCLSIRGPWLKTWEEYDFINNKIITFTNGREIVKEVPLI